MHSSARPSAPHVCPRLFADRTRSSVVRYEDETSAMRVVVLRIAVRQAHTGNASNPSASRWLAVGPAEITDPRAATLASRPLRHDLTRRSMTNE